MKLCILIRGHIRSSFDNDMLLNKIRLLNKHYNIFIYIQTWNKFEASKSWRKLDKCDNQVKEDDIYNYFKELRVKIRKIIILNENYIDIIGNKDGFVSETKMPILNWKFMWYGIYMLSEYVYNNINHTFNKVLNLRFDIFNHSLSEKYLNLDNDTLINKINTSKSKNLITFFTIKYPICVDNIYVSNINFLYKIHYNFCHNLDDILQYYPTIIFQESIFYFEVLKLHRYYDYVIFGFNDYALICSNYFESKKISILIVDSNKEHKSILCNNINIIRCDYNEFASNNNFENVSIISQDTDNINIDYCKQHIKYNPNETYNFNEIKKDIIDKIEYKK